MFDGEVGRFGRVGVQVGQEVRFGERASPGLLAAARSIAKYKFPTAVTDGEHPGHRMMDHWWPLTGCLGSGELPQKTVTVRSRRLWQRLVDQLGKCGEEIRQAHGRVVFTAR